MAATPDPNRRWTLVDASALLWSYRISLELRGDGYHVRDARGGALSPPDYVTDDLIDALTVGFEMAGHPPTIPICGKRRRRRRLPTRKAKIRSHNASLARRKWKAMHKQD